MSGPPTLGRMNQAGGGDQAPLAVEISSREGALIVALSGELDISNVATLERELDAVLASNPPRLVFDLGQLRFLDSSGIGLLLRIKSRTASIEVRKPTKIVQQVIEYMGLANVLGMTA